MEGYQARSFDCELGSHFHHGHVFEGPPIMPDGRISQVRFEALASRSGSLPIRHEVQALVRIRPDCEWFALSLVPSHASAYVGAVSDPRAADGTTKYPESLCPILALPDPGDVNRLLRGHYSSVIAPTDSCANPK